MIDNDIQLDLTKRWLGYFLRAEAGYEGRLSGLTEMEKSELSAVKNQIAELESQIQEYEDSDRAEAALASGPHTNIEQDGA
ncbi:MAG: hypothetical protein JRN62_02635 [Nitrososphaerota archaeon]|jgi:hypothetical protein|nr:hypothetical protein [Nitrososphaerota archaeon]MDG6948896.1 hypothetical protein [Nitrososphaerota archaeon]